MPNESKRKRIVDDMISALRAITAAGGYWHDVARRQVADYLVPLDQIPSAELPKLVVLPGAETRTRAAHASAPRDRSTFKVHVLGYVKSTDRSYLRRDLERLLQDARRALLQDPQRSGLALWTVLDSIESDEGELAWWGFGAFEMELTIVFDEDWIAS